MTSPKRVQRYGRAARGDRDRRSQVRLITATVSGTPGVSSESLVSWDLGGGNFVIRSVPVVAVHLAHGDIVSCTDTGRGPVVDGVVLRGGGSTLRLLVTDDDRDGHAGPADLRERLADQLIVSGCLVERMGDHILAVGVGPDVDRGDIGTLCDSWEDAGVVRVLTGFTAEGPAAS